MIGQHLGEQGDVLRLVTKVAKDLLALQVEVEEWTSVDVLGGQPNRNRLAINVEGVDAGTQRRLDADGVEGNVDHAAMSDVLDFLHELGVVATQSVVGADSLSALEDSVIEINSNDGDAAGKLG